jgi:hypothetical protein
VGEFEVFVATVIMTIVMVPILGWVVAVWVALGWDWAAERRRDAEQAVREAAFWDYHRRRAEADVWRFEAERRYSGE